MKAKQKAVSSFINMLDEELKKIHDTKGAQAAVLSKNAFQSRQILDLVMILTVGHDDEDYADRIVMVQESLGHIIGVFMADLGAGMTDDEHTEAMQFADRMYHMQRAMAQSIGAVRQ